MINYSNHTEKIAETCKAINDKARLSKCNRKLTQKTKSEIRRIIKSSGFKPDKICMILGVEKKTFGY
jgi:hypothetical protein